MKNHTKIYLEAFGYDLVDQTLFVPSEISGNKSIDIHHIIGRGKGGKDRIENLMALTREEHILYGDVKSVIADLLFIHESRLNKNNIPYDKQWFLDNYKKYKS